MIVNCKTQQTFYTDKATDTAVVNWEVPEATDNKDLPSDILVLQTSGPERGSVLTIGETYITYMAEDTAGIPSRNNCSITVYVKG